MTLKYDIARCLCGAPADRNLTWPTSRGPVSMDFCQACADDFWRTYKNTPSGHGLTIRPVLIKERVEP